MPSSRDLAGELRIAIGRASRRIRAERGEAGLTDPQFTVLAWLTKEGPLTPGQLAERERIQPPSMTRTVNSPGRAGPRRQGGAPDRRPAGRRQPDGAPASPRSTRPAAVATRGWPSASAAMTSDERALLVDAAELLRRIAAS